MRALDTSVHIRFVTNDDASQAGVVERLFAECQSKRAHLFVSTPAMSELRDTVTFDKALQNNVGVTLQ